jgi:hypothetical protein
VFLDTIDCPIDEFYKEVRAAKNETDDAYMLYFIDCLLASADYDSFYKVMAKQGNLLKQTRGQSKAEDKGSSGRGGGYAKGEGKSSKGDLDDEADGKYDEK